MKQFETLGPGFFMRSHATTPYAWADVFFGPNKDVMHIIDKASLEIVETLRPEPGATVAHTEFTKGGRYALVSIREDEGAVIVYDAATLDGDRLPMQRPSGKYNGWNKITSAEGYEPLSRDAGDGRSRMARNRPRLRLSRCRSGCCRR